MPELPDITAYLTALTPRVVGQRLEHLRIASPLLLRTAAPLPCGARGANLAGRQQLAAFDFPNGSLVLTEAGAKRRASLHLVQGEAALTELDPGGLDIFSLSLEAFRNALAAENHTLKRALTDPRVLSGIGNAYSDGTLH